MIDQRFLDDLAQDLKLPEEPMPEVQLASANTGVTTDAGGFVGYRLNMPKGLNTRENQAKQSVLIADTLAGAGKGAVQGFVGLPGDLESIGRMALGYLGYNVDENTALPTSEEIGKRLESVLGPVIPPNQTTGVPTEERVRAAEGGTTGGEILAPGGQVKLAKKVIKATKDLPVGMSIKMLDGTEQVLEQAPKINTKAFKNWFGDSKAVDSSNKPIVVYHGTTAWSDEIKNDRYRTGKFFTSEPKVAERFGKQLVPVYLKAENPFIVDAKGEIYAGIDTPKEMKKFTQLDEVDTDLIAEYAFKNGYDSVIIRNVLEGNASPKVADDYIVFEPTQIKSAISNIGTFDPKNPNILKGVGVGGTGAAMSQEENQ